MTSYFRTIHILDNVQLWSLSNNRLLYEQFSTKLKRSLDIFLVGCIIGLRFIDLVKLKTSNIRKFDGQNFVEMTRRKTRSTVVIPLPVFASDIISRQHKQKNHLLFSPISISNFNKHLKEIMELAGFTDDSPKYRHRKGRLVEIKTRSGESYRLCM